MMSNIAEGFEQSGTSEFAQFLAIAKGSAGEVRSELYVALDQEYITETVFQALCGEAERISKMVTGLMGYLRNSAFTRNEVQENYDDLGSWFDASTHEKKNLKLETLRLETLKP